MTAEIDERTIRCLRARQTKRGNVPNEEGKAILRGSAAAWNDHDLGVAGSLLTQNYVHHDPNGPDVVGPADAMACLQAIFDAFLNLRLDESNPISLRGLVAVRHLITGPTKARSTTFPLQARM